MYRLRLRQQRAATACRLAPDPARRPARIHASSSALTPGGRRADRDTTRTTRRPRRSRRCRRSTKLAPPTPAGDQQQRDGRREHAAHARAEKHDAVGRPRSRTGNQREKLRAMFGNAPASPAPNRNRIATSERKPARRAGEHRERRPPQHDPRQHAARAVHVAQPAGRNFEERVGRA